MISPGLDMRRSLTCRIRLPCTTSPDNPWSRSRGRTDGRAADDEWRMMLSRLRPRIKTCQQHGEDAGEENAVERSGAADGCDRRAEAAYLVEVRQVGADQ